MARRVSDDLTDRIETLQGRGFTRRQVLRLAAGILSAPALASILAACGDDDDDDDDTAGGTTPTSGGTAATMPAGATAPAAATGELEFFSWWTAGGEAAGLNAMYEIYTAQNPGVEIINAAVAGGAGSNAKAVLATRLTGGEPPDSFQLHAGLEIEKYAPEEYLEPIDDLFESEGWSDQFPEGLLTLLKYQDHYWSVPVNIHRANVLWYNKTVLADAGVDPPATFDDFFAACETLQEAGVTPFAIGTKEGWEASHVIETVLLGTLGADAYRGLWTGETDWTGDEVGKALENFNQMMEFANEDHGALTWSEAADLLIAGTAAMTIMGDWTAGQFGAKNFTDYGWAATPDTDGVFDALSDTFALPKNAPHRDNAIAWLKVAGSLAGQEAFNPEKGSICARTDCGEAAFEAFPATHEYLMSAAEDWGSNEIVPSLAHGAAAKESWVTEFHNAIISFLASGDVEATQETLQSACVNAEVCE
jgi:glucose/mannose transport system substrate-binding protein